MPWVRIDENAMGHPKVTALTDGAFRLWVEGLAHCQKYLTDGAITMPALRALRAYSPNRLNGLLASGLWVSSESGVQVHDYLVWNDSRDRVLEARQLTRDRLSRHREKKRVADTEVKRVASIQGETLPTPHHTTERSTNQNAPRAPKRKGHEHHLFCGTNFHVSDRQFELLEGELGEKRNGFDLFAALQRWDQLNEPVMNLLPYIKAKIAKELGLQNPLTATQRAMVTERHVPSVDATKAYLQRLKESV